MSRILITGGAGYIGSKLAARLSVFNDVVVFDNLFYDQGPLVAPVFHNSYGQIKFYNEDVTDWSNNLIREVINADVIIPLAAMVGAPLCERLPEQSTAINYQWIEDLVARLRGDQLVVYPNTNSGYGSTGSEICTEETPSNPLSLYGTTKQKAEDYLLENHECSICFRLATVFGWSYRPRTDLLVNNLTKTAFEYNELEIFDGHFRRNYIHVNDIVRAFEFAIDNRDRMVGNVYNLGNDDINCTKKDLALKIRELTGARVIDVKGRTDPDKRDYIVSSDKLTNLGYYCASNLEYGIKEMLYHYENFHSNLVEDVCKNY